MFNSNQRINFFNNFVSNPNFISQQSMNNSVGRFGFKRLLRTRFRHFNYDKKNLGIPSWLDVDMVLGSITILFAPYNVNHFPSVWFYQFPFKAVRLLN